MVLWISLTALVQYQGAFICLLLALGWGWAALMRHRELCKRLATAGWIFVGLLLDHESCIFPSMEQFERSMQGNNAHQAIVWEQKT